MWLASYYWQEASFPYYVNLIGFPHCPCYMARSFFQNRRSKRSQGLSSELYSLLQYPVGYTGQLCSVIGDYSKDMNTRLPSRASFRILGKLCILNMRPHSYDSQKVIWGITSPSQASVPTPVLS